MEFRRHGRELPRRVVNGFASLEVVVVSAAEKFPAMSVSVGACVR